ncbi:protein of unknown function [Desulfonispora thiosulfatigenes DSM 11270]|uniref:DUF1540 domain-containing protein n=1 Tax=Desulfonispora thiosulfatigenes DSM 11270 TaxID=656914 RepID=A0A1W1VH11_DESTI|nr:DUF1540 domain-containing protein [Desulfonispora thiosulfatigenes]SMB92648.1 protein of unknown function [Desulfonispora thiosulfatigenes DSM 11270]
MKCDNIRCKVGECAYNKSGMCNAESIEVVSASQNMSVSTSDDTVCQTFKPKNSLS